MVASLVITRTHVRFYLAVRTVVNILRHDSSGERARVSRTGDGVLAIANFSYVFDQASYEAARKFVSA